MSALYQNVVFAHLQSLIASILKAEDAFFITILLYMLSVINIYLIKTIE